MRLGSKKLLSSIVIIALAVWVSAPLAQGDGDSLRHEPRPDTETSESHQSSDQARTFVEIELSAEGVIAYDSAGGRWVYDFEQLQFVAAPLDAGSEIGGRESGGRDETVPPVEVRCTEKKIIDYPALTAVYIGRDEYVDGDIVAYSRVTIKGWVKGNVQSFGKAVLITSTGRVDGNVEAPEVEIRAGGAVLGQVIETPSYEIPVDVIRSGFSMAGIWIVFGFTLAASLVAFLALSLSPGRVAGMTGCISQYPYRSAWMGLLFIFLLPAIILLVALTIVGLLVVWAVPLAYFVAFTVGMCATGYRAVAVVMQRLGKPKPEAWAGSFIGVAFYMGLWALAALALGAGEGVWYASGGFDVLLLVIAILVTCYPLLIGVGAAVMTRFGSRTYVGRAPAAARVTEPAPAPAPPPMPDTPARLEPRVSRPPGGPMPSDHSGPGRPTAPEN